MGETRCHGQNVSPRTFIRGGFDDHAIHHARKHRCMGLKLSFQLLEPSKGL